MSMTIASLLPPKSRLKFFSPESPRRFRGYFPLASSVNVNSLDNLGVSRRPFSGNLDEFPPKSRRLISKAVPDESGGDGGRGPSSMPERFRYLTKEAPDKPVRWPWLIAVGFMLYAWRSVLWELSNWSEAVKSIGGFLIYVGKLGLAFIFHFVGDPITSFIWLLETAFYRFRSIYSAVIAYAPIQELTLIVVLTSFVLAVAEAAVPDSVDGQPRLLTLAGAASFAAVANLISELLFWTLLLGLFGFAKAVKGRDYVSSALPVAAALAAVGEPWIRAAAVASYVGLAVVCRRGKVGEDGEGGGGIDRVPFPLLCTALAVGVRLAANWAGYRHLTWMVA